MYIVLVGPSGKCRKGTAMGPGQRFLRSLGLPLASEAITREALIRELKQSSDSHIDGNGRPHLHASLTIFSEELTVFLGYNNQQLMSDLCNWYDCGDTWTYRTKNMGTDDIQGVWVNLMGATTPDLLQTTMPRDAIGGGLTSRMIFVYEFKKGKIVPDPFLSEEEEEIGRKLRIDLDRICLLSGEFKMTEKYLEKWMNWYVAQENKHGGIFDDPKFAGYTERRPTHVMKLAMIFNASRTNSMIIDEQDFDNALDILEKTEVKMIHTFSGVGKLETSDIMNKIMGYIWSRKTATVGQILAVFFQDITKKDLEATLDSLESVGFISIEHTIGGETSVTYKDVNGLYQR